MDLFFFIILFIFWTLFWSFSSLIIYRIKSWEWWILTWRSHCSSCNKILKVLDLIPIISYLKNKWKCNYCEKKVSSIYPILEISSWILFTLIWFFLIDFSLLLNWNISEIIKLWFYLIIWFFTIIYTFYDILFLEIPEIILALWIWITTIILWIQTISPNFHIISNIPNNTQSLSIWIWAIILSITILLWLYIIMLKWLKEIFDIWIIIISIISLLLFKNFYWINLTDITIFNWLIWTLIIFIFFFLQILISKWAWMWWGDLRIAVLIWLILWYSLSIAWTMTTYMIWSIFWITFLIYSKIKNKWWTLKTQIPFWPFLATWFFLTIFLQNDLKKLIEIYFYTM